MAARDPITTISVHTSTMRLLQLYKAGAKSYDEVILRFIEDYPPESFLTEMARRTKERIIPAEDVYRKAGI